MAKLSFNELKTLVSGIVTANKVSYGTFSETRDNIVGLLDKIGKIVTLDTNFSIDKLARFDSTPLSFGKTIEEWQQDLIMPVAYDSTGANALAPHDPTYRPVFYSYTLGKKVIPTTIRNNDIERAVHFEEQFVSIVAMQYKRLEDSMSQYRYELKREMIARFIDLAHGEMVSSLSTFTANANHTTIGQCFKDASTPTAYGILVKSYTANAESNWAGAVASGYIIVLDLEQELAIPEDDTTGEAFIKQLKKDVEKAQDSSEGHSLNGNTLGATEGLVLLVKQGVMPSLEVDTFAGAFQRQELAVPVDIIVVKDFGTADSKYYAVLMDSRAMRLHNTYNAVRENLNGEGDFLNVYRHTEETAHISRNAFFKAYYDD